VQPLISGILPIGAFLGGLYDPPPTKANICSGGRSVEEYVFDFPASMKIVGYPKDYDFSSPAIDYKATYRMSGDTLTVRRELVDKTTSNICSATYVADYRKNARTIMRDLRSQILISN
jgi:hypothetical protein